MQSDNPYAPPVSVVEDAQPFAELPESPKKPALAYAGFWRRFGAYWVDVLVFLPVAGLAFYFGEKTRLFYLYWFLPGLAIGAWFHVYLVVKHGGTPGKILLKTRIAMLDGSKVTERAAASRYSVLFILSALSTVAMIVGTLKMTDELYFSLGRVARGAMLMELAPSYKLISILIQLWVFSEFITMLFNKKRRAVHDFIAGTVVVRREADV
ncbi:MAG: hypothetical protein JWL63_1742 [Rhodocyclales bacterium]|nr:hypothetical protein [Rhodocyclales bacterium]